MRPKALLSLCLMMFSASFAGCTKPAPDPALVLLNLPAETFHREAEYDGEMETLGDLSEAYLKNTSALRTANNKLDTLCVAAGHCEDGSE